MRILMSADAVGGVFTYATELIGALHRCGDEVILATTGALASPDQRRRIRQSAPVEWHQRDLALEWMDAPWPAQRATARWLQEIAERTHPDVIHLNSYALAAESWPAPVLVVAHSDVCSWWRAVHGVPPPPAWDRYRQAVAAGLQAADAITAPTNAMLRALRHAYGELAPAQRVIANGIGDGGPGHAIAKEPFVLAAGRLWDEAKNLSALVSAAGRLPPGVVRLAGDPGARPTGGCHPLGALGAEGLAAHRRRAAVFAAPARYEPFGLAILEAARDRCALVLGDIPSLRELWSDVAAFVDPDDPEALAGVLGRLLDEPGRARALGTLAHRRSLQLGSRPMADAYHGFYQQLVTAAVPA